MTMLLRMTLEQQQRRVARRSEEMMKRMVAYLVRGGHLDRVSMKTMPPLPMGQSLSPSLLSP
jgi:hypothetical protein